MRDEEKSSVLPSMAAGLRTILFNVTAEGQELDQVPKSHSGDGGGGGRYILQSIPLGGMIRDSILSSSLPNGQRNNKNDFGAANPAFPAASYADSNLDNYLNPVIMSPTSNGASLFFIRVVFTLFP